MTPNEIIDLLGGTTEVARLCQVKPPSVSQWRGAGIPPARLMYLKVIRPDVFEKKQNQAIKTSKATPHA
ncbi:MAG: Cro/CI family transcriptional regulator [Betaproteobacteria bacterium]